MANASLPRDEVASGNPRLREAMLYVMRHAEDDPAFDAAKLDAMLFFADASHYRSRGETITGETYLRLPHGPSPRSAAEEIRRLRHEGAAVEVEVASYNGRDTHRRLKALREPDAALLSAEATAHLDQAVAEVKRMTAAEAADATRRMPIWRWAEDGAPLDFALLLTPVRVETEVSDDAREAALESARRQGLL